MKIHLLFSAAAAIIALISCSDSKTESSTDGTDSLHLAHEDTLVDHAATWESVGEKDGIRIAYFPKSPDFPDAKLTLIVPAEKVKNVPADKVLFQYKVENFELSSQTPGAHADHCANSAQGQHIHNILNGGPYTAHYTDTFSKTLEPGNYLNLSFLSRSYHESIKHKGAYRLSRFIVGMDGWKGTEYDLASEMMFYSRPKGEYTGKDTKVILLDFYLVNTTLSETGNKVIATINGNEFILTRWVPYAITGLPMGDNTIKLVLIDGKGSPVPGPYNSVERIITLKP